MSVKAVSHVLERSKARGSVLLVHIVLADAANQEGLAWPAQKTLARLSRLSDRSVRRALAKLVHLGEIEVVGKTEAGTVVYRIRGLSARDAPAGLPAGRPDGNDHGEEGIGSLPPPRTNCPTPRTDCPTPPRTNCPPLANPVRGSTLSSLSHEYLRPCGSFSEPYANAMKKTCDSSTCKRPEVFHKESTGFPQKTPVAAETLFDLAPASRAEAVIEEVEERLGRLDLLVRAGGSRKGWRLVLGPWLMAGWREGEEAGRRREDLVRRAASETAADFAARRSNGRRVIRGPAGAYFWGVLRSLARAQGLPVPGKEGGSRKCSS